jgi:hypothetical protein
MCLSNPPEASQMRLDLAIIFLNFSVSKIPLYLAWSTIANPDSHPGSDAYKDLDPDP